MSIVSQAQATTPPKVLASDLCWLLTRASQLLTGEFSRALEASGISPRQHAVLVTAMGSEHTQTDLARIVGLDKTTMMVTVDELERDGLAERRPMPSDRRARLVAVTPDGKRAVAAAEEILGRVRDRMLGLLPPEQRDSFLESLGCLACSDNVGTAGTGPVHAVTR